MISVAVRSDGQATRAWELLSEPARWPQWSPQVRGARGLGSPVVRAGAVGVVLAGPWIPVPARVTGVEPGRRWDWTIGPVRMRHRVEADGDGSLITVELIAPPPIEATLGRAYAPLMRIALRRLARLAGA